jgi:hypothetical protein
VSAYSATSSDDNGSLRGRTPELSSAKLAVLRSIGSTDPDPEPTILVHL